MTVTTDEGGDGARALATAVRGLLPAGRPGVVVVGAESGGGAVLVAAVNPAGRDAAQDASALVRRLLNGRGGGSPELAQGGGVPAGRLPALLDSMAGIVAGA